jgi:hypothetical protein
MMRTPILLLGSVSLLLVAAACGGHVVFDGPPAGTGAGGAGTGGTTSTSTQTGTINGVTTGPSVVTGVGAGPGTSTSVTTGTTTGPTSVVSSSSGGPPVQVSCNGMPCMPGQICCFNPSAPGDHCGESGQCGGGFVELLCNSPDDCPGGFCCAKVSNDPNGMSLQGTSCQTTCGGMDEIVVCAQMQVDVCPMGTGCHQQPQLGVGNGYRFCVP